MLFDITYNQNTRVVVVSAAENTWTLGVDDLQKHNAAWLVNILLYETDGETLD